MKTIPFDDRAAYAFLEQLAFAPRLGGTPAERRGALLIQRQLRAAGLSPRAESFPVASFAEGEASVSALRPFRQRYEAAVVGRSGSTPPGGVRGSLCHLATTAPADLAAAAGKVVITQMAVDPALYRGLRHHRVKALVQVSPSSRAAVHLSRREAYIRAYGTLPSVTIGYDDAVDLMRRGAAAVRVVARQRALRARSQNVTAAVRGTDLPNERIVLCAHYDSVSRSPGALDNAGGSALLMELARRFAAQPARRSLQFIWFGAEELGLWGSFAWVRRHRRDFAAPRRPERPGALLTRLLVNLDMAGVTFGANGAVLCGSQEMEAFVAGLAREQGLPMTVRHEAYSSDNIAFNERGVPSISLYRAGASFGHTPLDTADYLSAEGLGLTGRFAAELVRRAADAATIPFSLAIPEQDGRLVREYLERSDPYYRA